MSVPRRKSLLSTSSFSLNGTHLPSLGRIRLGQLRQSSTQASQPTLVQQTLKPTPLIEHPGTHFPDYDWYDWWVRKQIEEQPKSLFIVMRSQGEEVGSECWLQSFVALWQEVWVEAQQPFCSIDSILNGLWKEEFLVPCNERSTLDTARHLVLAILGWQTMLFRPDMGSCCPGQLAILDETEGHRGHAHMRLRQDQSTCKEQLCNFLMGFGVMLPCQNFNLSQPPSDGDPHSTRPISNFSPGLQNAHLLVKVGRMTLKWTDSMACHIELDKSSNALYIFRYPSFCLVHLASNFPDTTTTLQACADASKNGSYWATADDLRELLREILLSYRLLFGQQKQSRKLFLEGFPFQGIPEQGHDKVLSILCGRKRCPDYGLQERDVYDGRHDFPILKSRISSISNHLSNIRPRTWKEMWNDKRDSASWYTFWAVIIIGGLGICLGFVQAIFQIIQTAIAIKELNS